MRSLSDTLRTLALESPAARELEATTASGFIGGFVLVLGDVDVGHRELVAFLDGTSGDEVELGGAVLEGGFGRRFARVAKLSKVDEVSRTRLIDRKSATVKYSRMQKRGKLRYQLDGWCRKVCECAPGLQGVHGKRAVKNG